MAERRMFSKKVTDDDEFMGLSASAQALYLHLSMSADDDGFCNQINICMFKAHASISDLQALLEKRYVYQFENGVVVIRHWRMANALRKDRYNPTIFQEELEQLGIKNNVYVKNNEDGCRMVAGCLPQVRLGKDSIGKDNNIITPEGVKKVSLKSLVEERHFPKEVETVILEWLKYKKEKHQGYKETGFKNFLTQVQNNIDKYGSEGVIHAFTFSMGQNYQGVVWDKCKDYKPETKPSNKWDDIAQELIRGQT